MNYLVHLYLAEDEPLARLGNLAGDFVKGRIDERYPPALARGLVLHRQIDVFAHYDPAFNASRHRLDPGLGLYRGVLVDVFYDHFLAAQWDAYHPLPLERYVAGIYADLQRFDALLPEGLRRIAPRMIADNWLLSYRQRDIVALVLDRMAGRHPSRAPLAAGMREFELHEAALADDFTEFMTRARAWRAAAVEG